jgi:hypothetical protein
MTKNYQIISYNIYISLTSSSSPGFIYVRASHVIQGKNDGMSPKSRPWTDQPLTLLSGILVPSIGRRQNFQTYAITMRAWRRSLGKSSLGLFFVR